MMNDYDKIKKYAIELADFLIKTGKKDTFYSLEYCILIFTQKNEIENLYDEYKPIFMNYTTIHINKQGYTIVTFYPLKVKKQKSRGNHKK